MKLRNLLKSIFVIMLLFIITGCNEPSVVDIKLSEDNIKQDINDFNISDITLTVTYDDNTVNIVNVTNEMLSIEDLDKLNVVGKHDIKINYLDKVITLNINLTNYYEVTFILDDKVVDTQTVEHGMDAILPNESTTNKEGYTFIGWNHDGKNITEDTIIIGTNEINTYEVTFIINDLEIYEENRTFIYGETLNNDLLLYFENKYKIQIEKILIDNSIYNNEIITKNCTIQIFTEDYYSDKSNNKSDLNNVNNIEYELCVAFSNDYNSNKIITSRLISENDLLHFKSFFENYLVNEKDVFNVYFVMNDNIDYVIIQSQVNAEKMYMYNSNLEYKFKYIIDYYVNYYDLEIEKEILNGTDSGIYFKYEKGVFQFETIYNEKKYEIDFYKKFYKVYNDTKYLKKYEFNVLNPNLGEGKLKLERFLFQEKTGVASAVLFKVKKYINLVGYVENEKDHKVIFEDIRWYEVNDETYINTYIGDRKIFIKIRKINGEIDGYAFRNGSINVEANYFMLYQEMIFSKFDIQKNDLLLVKLMKKDIENILNNADIYYINAINDSSRFFLIESVNNILYIKVRSGSMEEDIYNSEIENQLGEFYEKLKEYLIKDVSFETKNNKIIYYSYISLENIKDLYN